MATSNHSHISSGDAAYRGNGSNLILLALSLLSVLPVWLCSYPPMCDLPQHAAQVALLRNLHTPSFTFANSFHVNWFTPYLFGYMVAYGLTPIFGIVTAFKLLISLALIAMPLATSRLLLHTEADTFWAILTIPGLYGLAYQLGLINFLVAAPIGILFLYYFISFSKRPTWIGVLTIAAGANLLFFCHALVCAFFLTIAAVYAMAETPRLRDYPIRVLPLLAVLPTAALWTIKAAQHSTVNIPITPDGVLIRLFTSFPYVLGVRNVLVAAVICCVLATLPFLAGATAKMKYSRWCPFFVYFLVLFFVPSTAFGTAFVYERFSIFAIPVCLFVIDRPTEVRHHRSAYGVAILAVLLLIGKASKQALNFDSQVRGFNDVLQLMQPGQKVLYMPFNARDHQSIAPTMSHFGSWYTALKAGMVDPSAALYYTELVVYNPGQVPKAAVLDFELHPEEFEWSSYHAEQYRYFVVRSQKERTQELFSSAACPVILRFSSNEWWLYERGAPCSQSLAPH